MSLGAATCDRIETGDLDAASAFLSDAIVPCRLARCERRPLLARVALCGVGRIGMAEASYGARVRVDTACRPDEYIIEVWLSGHGRVSRPGGRTRDVHPGTIVVRAPGAALATEMAADCRILVLKVSSALAAELLLPRLQQERRALSALAGDGALAVLDRPLDPAAARILAWLLAERCSASPIFAASGLAQDLEKLVAGALCGSEPRGSGAWPSYLRRAASFIARTNGEPISLSAIAGAAGVSKRTLQAGFQRWTGMSPLAWLRRQRLERAHAALRSAPLDGDSVTAIALDCGFNHLGRFAASYRPQYGVSPSAQLRLRA